MTNKLKLVIPQDLIGFVRDNAIDSAFLLNFLYTLKRWYTRTLPDGWSNADYWDYGIALGEAYE